MKFTTLPLVLLRVMSLLVKKKPTHPYTIITLDAFGIAIMNIEESIINPTSEFFHNHNHAVII